MTKNNRPVIRGVLCFSSPGKSLRITGCDDILKKRKAEDPPNLKTLLERLYDVKIALMEMDLSIADYRFGGGVSVTPPPAILDDPELFGESNPDPVGE